MSCFWDSILSKIKYEDYLKILNFNGKPSPKEFIELLKSKNKKTENIIWNTKILSEKQYDENYIHIKEYNSSKINQGYDCSICDPFLLLITELFQINIIHIFMNQKIEYCHKENIFNNNYTIQLTSNRNHMW